MEIRTIAYRFPRTLAPGQSTFEYCFGPLFSELRDCSFIVDNWRPDDLHPAQREVLARYRVAAVDVGQRVLDVYRGKRFLATFGFAIPANYGKVFAFATQPHEAAIRSSMWDGYQINDGKLAALALAAFSAFEGAWTIATTDPQLVDVLRVGLPEGTVLAEPPPSLRGVFTQP